MIFLKPLLCPPELLRQDLSGKTYVVTGGNSGIGWETVKQLASQRGSVVLACRNVEQGNQAIQRNLSPELQGRIKVQRLDLADLDSVRAFSKTLLETQSSLHGLVNNAGVMNTPFGKTKDGFEIQFGTNHLGHFLLTELLIPLLKTSAPSRIVNLSSCYHDKAMGREGRIYFEDLHFEKTKYDGWKAYAQSKLANLLHAKHLATRLRETGVIAVSVHPGWVRTNLIRQTLPLWVQNSLLKPLFRLGGMIEPWEGAQTTLYTLLAPEVASHSGAFFSQTGFYRNRSANRGGWPLESPNPQAHDELTAKRLDEVSRELVKL